MITKHLSLRVVDPIADEGVRAIIDDGCNCCCHGEVWRQNAEAKNESRAPSNHLGNYFRGVGTSTTSGKLKNPMTIRLQEFDLVIRGVRTFTRNLPKDRHIFCYCPQACQAKLGMTKCVRDGSITLDDYDAQSLEVVRQIGTGLFTIRMDHLIYNDYVRNSLLDDLVIDFEDEPGIASTARDSDQTNSPRLFHTCDGECSRLRDSEECAPGTIPLS